LVLKISRAIKFRIEYLALLVIAFWVRLLPRKVVLQAGFHLGRLACRVMSGRRRQADENIRLALPEMLASERREKIRQAFEHVGISGMEMLRLDMYRSGSDDLEQYFEFEGTENLQEAFSLGRGVLLLTGHLGFWEVGHFALPELGFPCDSVAKPMKNPLTNKYVVRLRESFGARVLDSKKGARRILKSLQAGRCVAILLDQHISPPGAVQVDFFGRKAFTTTAITNLAMKYQIPVVPMFGQRLPDFRCKIVTEPMMLLENGDDPDLVRHNTQLLTDRIEAAIRQDVSQWFWMHKRWRER
jgi:KDO2-lipid IV(A) lauroyltransferase